MESNDKMVKTWIKIYPIYIDKGMKRSEGRKVADEFSVENPSIKEIFAIVKSINLECFAENKHHPKDWMKRGRIIVKLKSNDSSLIKGIKNKNELLKYIGKELAIIKAKNAVQVETQGGDSRKKRRKK